MSPSQRRKETYATNSRRHLELVLVLVNDEGLVPEFRNLYNRPSWFDEAAVLQSFLKSKYSTKSNTAYHIKTFLCEPINLSGIDIGD